MAKKRKTRQEKVIADLRRKLQVAKPVETQVATSVVSTYSLPQTKSVPKVSSMNYEPTLPAGRQGTQNYAYVLSDLKKTALLTAIAIAAQGVLYFLLML